MQNGPRRRLTYANVMSTVAVFGVLAGGGAYAAGKVGPNDIRKNAVRAKHVKANQVRAKHIAPGTPGVALAGARVSGSGTVLAWFNRRGGKPTVDLLAGSGRDVKLPGVPLSGWVATAAINGGSTGEAFVGVADGAFRVRTRDSAGTSADRGFTLLVYKAKPAPAP